MGQVLRDVAHKNKVNAFTEANTFAPDQVFVSIIAAEVREVTDNSWIDFSDVAALVHSSGTVSLTGVSGGVVANPSLSTGSAQVSDNLSVGGAVSTTAVWDASANSVLDLTTVGLLVIVVPIQLPHLNDASAPNDSTYFSTTAGKLAYKDSGGTVHALY